MPNSVAVVHTRIVCMDVPMQISLYVGLWVERCPILLLRCKRLTRNLCDSLGPFEHWLPPTPHNNFQECWQLLVP